jgi:hypothetical protein
LGQDKSDVLQGTLDLMVLKTLDALGAGPRHNQLSGIVPEKLRVGFLQPRIHLLSQNGEVFDDLR